MNHELKASRISLSLIGVWSIILVVISATAAYYGTVNAQNEKIATVKEDVNNNISADRQRLSTLEEAVRTTKDWQAQTGSDIKEILRRLPR